MQHKKDYRDTSEYKIRKVMHWIVAAGLITTVAGKCLLACSQMAGGSDNTSNNSDVAKTEKHSTVSYRPR